MQYIHTFLSLPSEHALSLSAQPELDSLCHAKCHVDLIGIMICKSLCCLNVFYHQAVCLLSF